MSYKLEIYEGMQLRRNGNLRFKSLSEAKQFARENYSHYHFEIRKVEDDHNAVYLNGYLHICYCERH